MQRRRNATANNAFESNPVRRRIYTSPQVVRLIDRIRGLVAEERRLATAGGSDRLKAVRLEIARLQERLANMVRRELHQATPVPCP